MKLFESYDLMRLPSHLNWIEERIAMNMAFTIINFLLLAMNWWLK